MLLMCDGDISTFVAVKSLFRVVFQLKVSVRHVQVVLVFEAIKEQSKRQPLFDFLSAKIYRKYKANLILTWNDKQDLAQQETLIALNNQLISWINK